MSEPPKAVEVEKKPEKVMRFSDFLEGNPPGAIVNIMDAMTDRHASLP
jgi:hypothetical protein